MYVDIYKYMCIYILVWRSTGADDITKEYNQVPALKRVQGYLAHKNPQDRFRSLGNGAL